MANYQRISITQAKHLLTKADVTIIDIRDQQSYQNGHIDGALFINNTSIDHFINTTNKALPLLVYCYHGNSSQNASHYFSEQGFQEVYSMDGGYEEWQVE